MSKDTELANAREELDRERAIKVELLAALNQLQYAYRQIAGLHDPNTDDAFTVIAHNAIAKAKGA